MIITIDGPAGTGKTTIARKLAEKLGYNYFDTGAMYRAITYALLKNRISLVDRGALAVLLSSFRFQIKDDAGDKQYFLNDENVTQVIRSREVTQYVSEVSANPEVRKSLVNIQREFGKKNDAVFEGRDMGSVVFPQAELKIFLTATPEVRAERRFLEFKAKNSKISQQEVLQEIIKRDDYDSTREASPLKQAEDAHLIDTSDLTIDQVVEKILTLMPKKRM